MTPTRSLAKLRITKTPTHSSSIPLSVDFGMFECVDPEAELGCGLLVSRVRQPDVGAKGMQVPHLPEDGEAWPRGDVVSVCRIECLAFSRGPTEPCSLVGVYQVELSRSRANLVPVTQDSPVNNVCLGVFDL